MSMIVGLGYKARSGKDTVADHLEQQYGFVRAAFADALKRACAEIFGLTRGQLYGDQKGEIDPFWNTTPRDILQRVGTECLRRGFRDDVWVKALERRVVDHPTADRVRWVITDVRFPNEADAIKRWGGKVYRVDRPAKEALGHGAEQHASEVSMDRYTGWDGVIVNDGTIEDLHERAVRAIGIAP